MFYYAHVCVYAEFSGEIIAEKTSGPFMSYEYASGIAQEEIVGLWADMKQDEGLRFEGVVRFGKEEEFKEYE
jgi:hypothetical protein